MMINLNITQIEFISTEFGVSADELVIMDKNGWKDIRKKCYDIVLDELLDENDEYTPEGDTSVRCLIASQIMDIKYKFMIGSDIYREVF